MSIEPMGISPRAGTRPQSLGPRVASSPTLIQRSPALLEFTDVGSAVALPALELERLTGGMRERPLMEAGLFAGYRSVAGPFGRLADVAWITGTYYATLRAAGERWDAGHSLTMAQTAIVFLLVAEAQSLYRPWRAGRFKEEGMRLLKTWAIVVTLLSGLALVAGQPADPVRWSVLSWLALAPIVLGAWRGIDWTLSRRLGKRHSQSRSVAIIGDTCIAEKLVEQIRSEPWLGLRLDGIFDDRCFHRGLPMRADPDVTRGDFAELLRRATAGQFDVIYITLPLRAEPRLNQMIRALGDTTASVYVVPDHFVFGLMHARWDTVGDLPVVRVLETPFQGIDGWVKRAEDLVIGTIILILLAIPMGVIAAGVKLTSPGPVLFRQRRHGLRGEPIHVLKFRSMTVCEDGDVVKQATRNDPRTTQFGSLLRRTSLDELPQFFQVLTGEMSIVGPRPHAIAHGDLYRHKIHDYMSRHKVKPGITGWAQVNGWRGETDTDQKMAKRIEYDLAYIHNWGLWWDLRIILQTVLCVVQGSHAY
jgi:putative colanic acid biosynthesis UDP-glucose lipid carrier transferase